MVEQKYTGPFRIGDTILEYEVLGLLGAGGHAFVYESKDPYLGTPVAIKVIQKPTGGSDLIGRGRAEARVLSQLEHPNVVRVHLARPLGDTMICIVMEKLEGLSLRQLLRLHKRLTVAETLRIVRQIADGLSAAHKRDVIHRDVKPENIYILPSDNRVKVLDFGIAKFVGMGMTTSKYRLHGTPAYMSPEHLRDGTVTVQSDVYQLLLVAFEMLAGINPCLVDLDNPDFDVVAYRQIKQRTPSVTKFVRGVPASVDYLIQKGTSKEPTRRYASMDELIEAVDQCQKEFAVDRPLEANQIRYLDEVTIRAAKALEVQHDPWSEDDEPSGSAAIDADASPSVDQVLDGTPPSASALQTKAGPVGAIEAPALPTDPKPPNASARPPVERIPALESIPIVSVEPAQKPLEPRALDMSRRAKSVSRGLAPTMESSRLGQKVLSIQDPTNAGPVASESEPSSNLPIPDVYQSAPGAQTAQTNDAYTRTPPRRTPQAITPALLASAAVFGGILGVASSWPLLQEARQQRQTQARAVQPSALIVAVQAPSASSAIGTTATIPSPIDTEQSRVVPEPSFELVASVATVVTATTNASAVVAAPSKPNQSPARPKKRKAASAFKPDGEAKLSTSQTVSKEDLARMQARLRQFNADMDREAREQKAREAKK